MILFTGNILDLDVTSLFISSENARFPLANLKAPQMAKFTRVNAGTNLLELRCAAPQTIDSIIIGGVSPFAYGGANFSSCVFSSSADSHAAKTTITKKTNESHLYVMFDTPITASVFRLTFEGDGNKDIGALYMGCRMLGPGMEPSQTIDLKWSNTAKRSNSGQLYGSLTNGYEYIEVKVPLPRFSDAMLKALFAVGSAHRNVKPMFVKIWNKYDGVRLIYCAVSGDGISVSRSGSRNKPYKSDITFTECF